MDRAHAELLALPDPALLAGLEVRILAWAQGQGWFLERTGPLRRGQPWAGRLEFIKKGALSPEAWGEALGACTIFAEMVPEKREAKSAEGICVKFFQAPGALFGFAQLAHTGPTDFVAGLRLRRGWDQGPAEDEQTALARLGLPWMAPEQRSFGRLGEPGRSQGSA
ncbi:MAG: hypothetical protein ACYDCX_02510 [Acidithiobacillus sp.]